ncbi:porphobilinogen synthase [hydrocarbon metagenome]|uniref:Delta-aminolevulinic acid dehydratase n=1 Tax=hydrocarbon metagenome TaxID=938273 RepID=A0A0W8E7S8_9ZZZZ
MGFPINRMRRLRSNETIRRMVRETAISVNDFIYPLFVIYGQDQKNPIKSMPGVFQFSVDDKLKQEIKELESLRIPGVILFGIPECKDSIGSSAYQENGVIQQAIRLIKDTCPDLMVITDVCMCEYTDHGHCGIVDKDGTINNDATLELLAQEALSHVQAGCDMVAPSDMMDGRIGYIRKCLDDNAFENIPIMSYAAKYASGFYGPFRDAADSTPQFGDRRTHQMDSANIREALREVALDIEEGADIVMVKPALAYLDVIKAVKDKFDLPVSAYNVSGEYSMVKAAAENGWLDGDRVMMEILMSIKRAGADMILTYAAKEAARLLNDI